MKRCHAVHLPLEGGGRSPKLCLGDRVGVMERRLRISLFAACGGKSLIHAWSPHPGAQERADPPLPGEGDHPAAARSFSHSARNTLLRHHSASSMPVGNQRFPAFVMCSMMPRSANVRPGRPMIYGCIVNGMYFGRSGLLSE